MSRRIEILGGLVFLALIACAAIAYGRIRSARELQQSRDERRKQEVEYDKRTSQARILEESRARRAGQIKNWEDDQLSAWEEWGLSLIEEHKYDLYTERNRLSRQGPYGIVDDQVWIEEGIPYFAEAILMPSLTKFICNRHKTDDVDSIDAFKDYEWINLEEEHSMDGQFPEWIRPEDFTYIPSIGLEQKLAVWCVEHINHTLEKISLKEVGPQTSGEEFELICKELLEGAGWEVQTTSKTGDQGIDLVASLENMRVCIQCKRYSSPVGNSAVQEASAGAIYWKGTHAAVVTNAEFTKAAKQLASSTNVTLMHYSRLARLKEELENQ